MAWRECASIVRQLSRKTARKPCVCGCRIALRHAQAYSNAADVALPLHLQGTSALLKAICTLFGRPLRVDKDGGAGGGGCGGGSRGGCGNGGGGPRCAQDVAAERQLHLDKLDAFKVHYHMHVRLSPLKLSLRGTFSIAIYPASPTSLH